MSAEVLRAAANEIRVDQNYAELAGHISADEYATWMAVAHWLTECADDYGKDFGTPDAHALAIARAYLGASA